jgi:hypothetical protein
MAGKKQEKKENYTRERRPVTMPAGRPFGTFDYKTVDDLENAINDYFYQCDTDGKPYTMTGLAVGLNITPQTLCNYGDKNYADGKYFDTVNRARMRVLEYTETRAFDRDGSNGAKFMLTNNAERMGGLRYADRVEQAIDVAPISFVDDL